MSTKVYLSKLFVEAIFRDIFEKLLYRDVLGRKLPPTCGGQLLDFQNFCKANSEILQNYFL
jgi:hypothetical protein